MSRADLRTRLGRLRDGLREDLVVALQAYIEAQEGATAASIALFQHDWSDVKPFFEDVQKTEQRSLGQETHEFFEDKDLGREDLDYLRSLKARGVDPDRHPEDETFYVAHALQRAPLGSLPVGVEAREEAGHSAAPDRGRLPLLWVSEPSSWTSKTRAGASVVIGGVILAMLP